jgi:acetoin utilization protein AcuB
MNPSKIFPSRERCDVLVHEFMRANPITVSPKTLCSDAFRLMHDKDIFTLPVITEQGDLVGILAKKDLYYALPSSIALLSVLEVDNLFGEMTVAKVMTRRVILISEDCPLEEAARILVDNKIGSLPVVRGHRLIGIITKADLLRAMMGALGGRAKGLRITIRLQEDTGELGAITDGILHLGGKLSFLSTVWGDDLLNQAVTLKVDGVGREELISLLEQSIGVQVIDYLSDYKSEVVFAPGYMEASSLQDPEPGLLRFTHLL